MAGIAAPPGRLTATDTSPDPVSERDIARARLWRRLLLALFGTILALGATGVLGVRTGEVSASGEGYQLRVRYPKVTRPGHAVPFSIEVSKPGGFAGEDVTVAVTAGYFALFDANGMTPAPDTETTAGTDVVWTFTPPIGDVLRIDVDTRTGPNRQRGTSARVAVLVKGRAVASVGLRTRIVP